MSLSPFDSFQSRFVTYLLNRPRKSDVYPTAKFRNGHVRPGPHYTGKNKRETKV